MSSAAYSIHHVNIPIADPDRTTEWYGKVFGMRMIPRTVRQGGAPGVEEVLLLTHGDFDIHCTIHEGTPPDLKPHHYCVEVVDWDGFMAHLSSLGIETFGYFERPQNNSKATYMHDPDGNLVELAWHGDWNHEASPVERG
jgi:catechol 2,3-dioxygenase-like lactoylglutathione lyase family enzyme